MLLRAFFGIAAAAIVIDVLDVLGVFVAVAATVIVVAIISPTIAINKHQRSDRAVHIPMPGESKTVFAKLRAILLYIKMLSLTVAYNYAMYVWNGIVFALT